MHIDTDRIVEGMLDKAEQVVRDVFAEFDIHAVVAAYSGGDDSVVSTHWAMERFPDAVVMVADTSVALAPSIAHQKRTVEKFGWDCQRLRADVEGQPKGWAKEWSDGETPYEEFVLNHGFSGPPQHHRMYQRLKQRAFRKVKPLLGTRKRGSRIMVVSGIRRDESAIRAGYKRAFAEEPSECFVWANPFYHCTAVDFEAYRQEFGLPRNPVKRQVGISGECCCGAFAAPGERECYRKADPEFAAYLDALEQRVKQRFPWGWGEAPPRWYMDQKRGQTMMPFMPACVGCHRKQQAI